MFVLIIFTLLFSNIVARNEEYKGYRVYEIEFTNERQQDNLEELKSAEIDFWKKPNVKYGTVGKAMVPPALFTWFEEKLERMDVEKRIVIEDVYEYLKIKEAEATSNGTNNAVFDFDAFYRYNAILDHLYQLQNTYENSTAVSFEVVQYEVTTENRPLVYVKISNGTETNKPVVVVEAGIIPREWITMTSALYVIQRLLEEEQRKLLEDMTWIVVPVLNPDGYEYTHTNLRLWMKTRSLNSHLGAICPGANLNRNFDVDWSISDSSSSPCSHLYAGTKPFSETESELIRTIIDDYAPMLYISLQNNGKFVTFPWRYEKAASGLFIRHFLLGREVIKDLQGYAMDSGAIAFGDRESGTSTDYARMERVFFTYNVGMEEASDDGVIFPEKDIRRIAADVWLAVAALAKGVS